MFNVIFSDKRIGAYNKWTKEATTTEVIMYIPGIASYSVNVWDLDHFQQFCVEFVAI